jgi:hypothetical protein
MDKIGELSSCGGRRDQHVVGQKAVVNSPVISRPFERSLREIIGKQLNNKFPVLDTAFAFISINVAIPSTTVLSILLFPP